jgi:transposase
MARHQRDSAKEAAWRGLLQQFASSGFSVREFCRREQLSEAAFYAWRRTIAERDQPRSERDSQLTACDDLRSQSTAFVPVLVASSHEPSLTLELPGGCVLRFTGASAAEQLADLIFALQARSVR